jgi:hypothetical protein
MHLVNGKIKKANMVWGQDFFMGVDFWCVFFFLKGGAWKEHLRLWGTTIHVSTYYYLYYYMRVRILLF